MKKFYLLFIVILIIILGLLVSVNRASKNELKINNSATNTDLFSSQINTDGDVEVEAMPEISADKKSWSFKIALTTHSGSLDEDLAKNSILTNDQGNELTALRWEGTPAGGHHREGVLIFPSLSQTPKSVKLILKDIGEIRERSFTWNAE